MSAAMNSLITISSLTRKLLPGNWISFPGLLAISFAAGLLAAVLIPVTVR